MCQVLYATDNGPDIECYNDLVALGYDLADLVPFSAFSDELGPNGEVPAWFTTALCLCGFDIEAFVEAYTGRFPAEDPFGFRFPTLELARGART